MNNEEVLVSDIGEGVNGSLLCFTDLAPCCDMGSGRITGEWHLPSGSLVGVESNGDYYIERGPSVVRLNLRNNDTTQTGQFCCEVPDGSLNNQTVCATIGRLSCTHTVA